jgi:hypothetical protein
MQPIEEIAREPETTQTTAQPAVDAVVADAVTAEPTAIEAPTTPTVTITPPAEHVDQLPASDAPKASTIDEAISNFHEAVGHADANDQDASEAVEVPKTIEPALTPVEEIMNGTEGLTLDESTPKIDTQAEPAETEEDPPRPAKTADSDSQTETSPPFRRHASAESKAKMNESSSQPEAEPDVEGEGQTMDEIDLS